MWESLLDFPRGSLSTRNFMMFAASLIVASFGYLFAAATPVAALEGTWEGDNLIYDGKTYEPLATSKAKGLEAIPDGATVYQFKQTNNLDPNNIPVRLIYFKNGEVPKNTKEATYVEYTLNPPNQYSNPINEQTITLTTASEDPAQPSKGRTSCDVDSVGWLVCGLGGHIASGVDNMYGFLMSFLQVEPITDGNNSMYRLWEVMRNFANIAFIIGFMVIIYSYLVGGGFSAYEIKKIIPRLVLAAILINVSYWICAVAVDISNIMGSSLQDLLMNIRDTAVGTEKNYEVSWEEAAAYILSGGTIGAIAFLAPSIVGGSIASLAFMLLGVLITVAFALFVALVILAARQAIIIVLIVLAPIAFAAYVLPNTEKWFDRWRSIFTTMLVLFPIFSLLFGGSQLASAIIIQNADNLAVMLFGMAIQIVPLVITPLLIQFSGGLIGRIAGIVNNSQRGLVDRSKNWTRDRADFHKQKNLARPTDPNSWRSRANLARRGAQRMYAKDLARKKRLETYQKDAETLAHDKEFGTSRAAQYVAQSRLGQKAGLQERLDRQSYGYWDDRYRAADIKHHASEAHHERKFADALNTNPEYSDLRDLKRRTAVDSGVAGIQNAAVDAAGEEDLRRAVESSRALTRVVKDTYHSKKQAENFENIVQKAAEKSWSDRVRNDDVTQTVYLQSKRNEDGANAAEQQLKTFVQDVKTKGSDAPNVAINAQAYADNIKDLVLQTDISRNAEAAAQNIERIELAKAYKASAELRMKAGGIGGEAAANLVYAKAFQTMVNDQIEGTKAEKSILSQIDSDEIFKRMDNPDASVEQLAAYAGTIASRGFHAHHIKLLGKASRMYQEAVASGDEERIAKIRDMIQQIGSDQSKVAFGVRDYDRTLLGEGRYDANIFETTRERILTNLSPEVMANMDPDDIHLMYEMHRKGLLTGDQSQKIRDVWHAWQNDDILKSKIQTKHRNFLQRIDTGDYTSSIDGMSAPTDNKFGLTEDDFGQTPPDVEIRKM